MYEKSLLVILFSITLSIGFIPLSYSDYASPRVQLELGIIADDIQCKENHVLVLRINGSPTCLSEKTAQKMVDRFGWVIVNILQSENIKEDDNVKDKAIITDNNIKENTTSVKSKSVNSLMLSDPRITDAFGNTLENLTINQQVQITAGITNNHNTPTEFVYVVTVTDENNDIVNEKWLSAKLEPHQTFIGALSWIPEKYGKYVVSIGTSEYMHDKNLSDELILIITIIQDGNENIENINPEITNESISRSVKIFYDNNNNEIKRQYVNNTDTTIGYFVHSYNEFETKIEENEYDKFGNKIAEKIYDKNGKLFDSSQWEYDARGNEIKHKMFPVDFIISSMTIISEYNKYDDKIKETSLQSGEMIGITIWSYDENKNIIEEKRLNFNNDIVSWKKFSYNQSNKITEEKTFDKDQNLVNWLQYIYDQPNKITEEKTFDKDQNLVNWLQYIYDQPNKIIEEKTFDKDQNLVRWLKYTYDDDDNLMGIENMIPV